MATRPPPPPPGHDRIGQEGLDYLTIKDGQLYWHGAKLETEAKIRLSAQQGIGAAIIAAAAVVGALAASVSAWATLAALELEESRHIQSPAETPSPLKVAVFPAYFDSGVSIPKTESGSSLANAFRVLMDNPQATAVIRSYTDGTGSADLNERLAEARAANVRQFLTSRSIAPNRVTLAPPVAADSPYADNATSAGRAQNRRVEIEIVAVPQPASDPAS
ncbi:OmpA family protein [Parerythrobacter lacustris]|uniref:OmpA family protein n=1 Tax=Parerythrobacter lacustris TaxID=2969984 RepID=A0ABT1XL67_9SPHN|nr:OmpA family protein [Parerythrobacter lacustris]MCR2832400.1 OmpA family protein [Parerythrobacter lacustris]